MTHTHGDMSVCVNCGEDIMFVTGTHANDNPAGDWMHLQVYHYVRRKCYASSCAVPGPVMPVTKKRGRRKDG